MRSIRLLRRASAAVAFTAFAGCNFFDVSNPGPIADASLSSSSALAGLVTGMAFDLSRALDAVSQPAAISSDDLYHSGSYGPGEGLWNRGIFRAEDVNGAWGGMHRSRWVAEQGIERMKGVLGTGFDSSPLAARANIYAGLSNRLLGELTCNSVIDGGPSGSNAVHFQRAEGQFNEAIRIAGALTGALRDSLLRVSYGGRASVRAWQGNWTGAATDAALVPTSYVFVAPFSTNTAPENNDLAFETSTRFEFTVFNTPWQQVTRDPRVPWDTVKTANGALAFGQDGRTIFFRQRKYLNLGADIPLVKGTEMLLLRAEAALRNSDVPGAMTLINQARVFYNATATPLPPLTATTLAEAWPILQRERGATLWLESRRLWDLRRWNAETGPAKNTFLDSRDKCIPISLNEIQSNANLRI